MIPDEGGAPVGLGPLRPADAPPACTCDWALLLGRRARFVDPSCALHGEVSC